MDHNTVALVFGKRFAEKAQAQIQQSSKQFYDWQGTIKKAKAEGWDAPPYRTGTKGQQAERAVTTDYEYLRRWLRNDWWWCGYRLLVDGEEIDALWGIDSDSIDDFTKEAIGHAKATIDKEQSEREWAENHEIATT